MICYTRAERNCVVGGGQACRSEAKRVLANGARKLEAGVRDHTASCRDRSGSSKRCTGANYCHTHRRGRGGDNVAIDVLYFDFWLSGEYGTAGCASCRLRHRQLVGGSWGKSHGLRCAGEAG